MSSKLIPLCVLGILLNKEERQQEENRSKDTWSIVSHGAELVLYHVIPRATKFNPEGVCGCPTDISNLTDWSLTIGESVFATNVRR